MKSKIFLIGMIIALCMSGCGNGSKAQGSISDANSDLYTEKILMDGIKYQIPKSWEEKEYQAPNGLGYNLGIGYYLETSGSIKENTLEMIGYDHGNVLEGIELYVSKNETLSGLNPSEILEYLKEYLESENVEFEEISIEKVKGIKSKQDTKTTTYIIPLNNSMLLGYSVISDNSKLTRHTEEIEYVINSITLDESLLK